MGACRLILHFFILPIWTLFLEYDIEIFQAMRVIITDKRYGALKTLGEKKQAFNEV